MKPHRVVISGGGTGGHLYPGLAIARHLQAQHPEIQIHFVGAYQGLETRIVPKAGFPLHLLPVGGLLRTGIVSQLKTLALLPCAFLKSLWILLKLRPQVVLGVGGYASGPFVLMASFFVKNTFIWEPNAHPGLTNRWLSHFVKKVFVVFEFTSKWFPEKKVVKTGFPVRSQIHAVPRTPSSKFRVLIFGGSQGARGINMAVMEAIKKGGAWTQSLEILHQTGQLDFETVKSAYKGLSFVKVHEFLDNMDECYAWADLVVCRGGVGTVSELIVSQKASVIIPLPTAADNHQQKNAEVLVAAQAGEMVLQKDFTSEKFVELVEKYRKNPSLIESFEKNLVPLQTSNPTDFIVGQLLEGFL